MRAGFIRKMRAHKTSEQSTQRVDTQTNMFFIPTICDRARAKTDEYASVNALSMRFTRTGEFLYSRSTIEIFIRSIEMHCREKCVRVWHGSSDMRDAHSHSEWTPQPVHYALIRITYTQSNKALELDGNIVWLYLWWFGRRTFEKKKINDFCACFVRRHHNSRSDI